MEYYIVTYRSRTVTTQVYSQLVRKYNINCQLVSTPRGANVGCGLSIKMNPQDISALRDRLSQIESFAGVFLVRNLGGKTAVVSI